MSTRITRSVQEAKEQAAEFFGFTASTFIEDKNNKVWEIPNPGLLDDDQQERWEQLQFDLEQCDREDDFVIPSQTLEDGTVIPERTIPGDIITPHRLDGQLLKPPYNVRLAIALFGEEGYEQYKAGGGIANQIALEWARMNKEYQERVTADSKSEGSHPALEVVPSGD
ncbi:hypothetical protein JRC04_04820 [Mycolicibacterium sp. S2-37]|uniref:hypothetical protein n=1 Tax=Mycolicibacterium sp. S2-37 TaxID=2810297 RepID=UPI001A93C4B4|nr:hypothetical protein [Mycolicibacterium sp. S2-37]MBO0676782.1 hypothetical protein [Mycolicibacterium sp. S2-37]